METVQKNLILSGRVQGVGFRHFTRITAKELDVKGWVKNRRDGKVEALLQGETENVTEMIERLKKGPATARVDGIEIEDLPFNKEYLVFEVKS